MEYVVKVVWWRGQEFKRSGRAKLSSEPDAGPGPPIFTSDFESGNLQARSVTSPDSPHFSHASSPPRLPYPP